ncbi:MAG TPA: pyridine nucleotide-disulfide oxidoreductase [Ruminococcaceae bacterium]|jgi:thioredoxin reductase/Pyruvate/2-oxoacid:ferredoxin oxidoreductase delta subunit|nr:pyridine nucleotide-disulfide oxidoreductase [Oscillospiraceae bacterium]
MKRYELIVIGAGPAGLSVAVEAANAGMSVAVFDENARPGGQLFKQIHKFFGSKEHQAKIRGFRIGQQLLKQAEEAGVEVHLNSVVMGIFDLGEITVQHGDGVCHYKGDSILIATGACENMVPFDGWTLPGVMGAGAAQTMMNLHGVQPGSRVLMVGSGNVGLVVSFQLLQAGVEVAAVIDAAPQIGGYGVHAAKLARIGVPFYLSHTIVKAEGTDHVTGAVIAQVDESFRPIAGTEKHLDVDTVCIAVGLSPMSQLARMAGCEMTEKGGAVPVVDEYGQTSIPGLFVAGDVGGIEEASSAMIGGRIAGAAAARRSGYLPEEEFREKASALKASLGQLHEGMFSPKNKGRRDLTVTDEGYHLSKTLLHHGYLSEEEVAGFPGAAPGKSAGIHPVIECTQNIPCNPCQDACRFGCIRVGDHMTALPAVDENARCVGCGMCVASCPGQAIFLVNDEEEAGTATVTLPYEFLPVPEKGTKGVALGRDGSVVCPAEVVEAKTAGFMDGTVLLTMRVPSEMSMKARFFKTGEGTK